MRKISKKAFNLMKVCFVLLAVLVCGVYYLVFANELVPKVKDEISFEITIEETEALSETKKISETKKLKEISDVDETSEAEVTDSYDSISTESEINDANDDATKENDIEEKVVEDDTEGKVNINTASSDLLQTLKNIGPAVAGNIINYRESEGKFSTIEDIMKVKGIGEGKFKAIKDSITVDD